MSNSAWNYELAFSRNLGLLSPEEQSQIKDVRIAIAGMGGVGGIHLITLLRTGFQKFHIADFDQFELANFNRQYGANLTTLGANKADVMAELGRQINPDADIRVFRDPLTKENIPQFLNGCQIYVDGMDAFEIRIRRELFMSAHRMGMYSVTAGPIGFSTAYISFSPSGMNFDQYFGFEPSLPDLNLFARFLAGLSPRFLHLPYLDRSRVDIKNHRGPSAGLSCSLCAGIAAMEVLKIVLRRGNPRFAPCYQQFDAYRGRLVKGRLWFGSKNPIFRLASAYIYKSLNSIR